VFDGDVIADDRAALDKTAVADVAVAADHGTGLNVRKSPQTGAFADPGFLVHQSCLVFKIIHLKSQYPNTKLQTIFNTKYTMTKNCYFISLFLILGHWDL
jgi:hypothetical protein